jgi:hypothetical protein
VSPSEVLSYAEKHIGKKEDVRNLLSKLEDPVDVIETIVEKEIME